MAYQTVKGTYDILGSEYKKFEMVETLFKHFLRYSYVLYTGIIIEIR